MSVAGQPAPSAPRESWARRREREQREEAAAQLARQVADGTLVVRQATAEERARYGINTHQERVRRQREQEEQARLARRGPRVVPPELASRLEAARRAELSAPRQVSRLLAAIINARALSVEQCADITGLCRAAISDRACRARRDTPGDLVILDDDPENQLRAARRSELDAPRHVDRLMARAAAAGASHAQIALVAGTTGSTVAKRIRDHQAQQAEPPA